MNPGWDGAVAVLSPLQRAGFIPTETRALVETPQRTVVTVVLSGPATQP